MNRSAAVTNSPFATVKRMLWSAPRLLLVLLVRVYQLVVSPLLGPTCRYYPSCSAYCVQALTRHGVLWGTWLTVRRLLRCHPWAPGGVDNVPEQGWRAPWRRHPSTRADVPTDSVTTSDSAQTGNSVQTSNTVQTSSMVQINDAVQTCDPVGVTEPEVCLDGGLPPAGTPQGVGAPRRSDHHHQLCGAKHSAPVN